MKSRDVELCCRQQLELRLSDDPGRLAHSLAVGRAGEALLNADPSMPEYFATASYLHDIGYSNELAETGFHPIDGAIYLQSLGFEDGATAIVAYHTGSEFEAEQRGLLDQLRIFSRPHQDFIDAITLCDLTSSPSGDRVNPENRIDEILSRYPDGHAVHSAITQAREYLMECCRRAKRRFDLPDVWLGAPLVV